MLEPSVGSILVCGQDLAAHPWQCALKVEGGDILLPSH